MDEVGRTPVCGVGEVRGEDGHSAVWLSCDIRWALLPDSPLSSFTTARPAFR